jgi:TonB family protein
MIDMGQTMTNRVATSLLFTALLVVAAPSRAVDSDLYLAGLGLHQETGRNIYLGGIYLEREAPKPQNLTEVNGERIMEYRVIARRTSIRSLLGGMLLQSEVATGNPPDQATADFVDRILSAVSSSLYAGDSLEIRLTTKNRTIAMLNGVELARVSQKSVADYLLMGWVGESGPSTTFRQNITADQVDPSLLSELEATTYSTKRKKEIARWIEPKPPAAPVAKKAPAKAAVAAVAAATVKLDEVVSNTGTQTAVTSLSSLSSVDTGASATGPESGTSDEPAEMVAGEDAGQLSTEEAADTADQLQPGMQVASLTPTKEMLPSSNLEREIQALDIQEYSQRLGTFHSQLIRMVYGEIRYPKRAVRRSLEGRIELDVTMTAEGKILDIAVAVGSGHNLLDVAAVEAATKAFKRGLRSSVDPVAIAEFGDFSTQQLTVPVPISFQLQ